MAGISDPSNVATEFQGGWENNRHAGSEPACRSLTGHLARVGKYTPCFRGAHPLSGQPFQAFLLSWLPLQFVRIPQFLPLPKKSLKRLSCMGTSEWTIIFGFGKKRIAK